MKKQLSSVKNEKNYNKFADALIQHWLLGPTMYNNNHVSLVQVQAPLTGVAQLVRAMILQFEKLNVQKFKVEKFFKFTSSWLQRLKFSGNPDPAYVIRYKMFSRLWLLLGSC